MAYEYKQALFVKPYLDRTLTRTSVTGSLPAASTEVFDDYTVLEGAAVTVRPDGRVWLAALFDLYLLEPDLTVVAFKDAGQDFRSAGRRHRSTADGHLVVDQPSNSIIETYTYDESTGLITKLLLNTDVGLGGVNAKFSIAAGPSTSDVWVLTGNNYNSANSPSTYDDLRIRAFDPVTGAVTFDGPDIPHGIPHTTVVYGNVDNERQRVTLGYSVQSQSSPFGYTATLYTVDFSGEVDRVDTAPEGYRYSGIITGQCDQFHVLSNDTSGAAGFDLVVRNTRTGAFYETDLPVAATTAVKGLGFIEDGVLVAVANDGSDTLLYALELATNTYTLLGTMTGEVYDNVKAGGGLALPWGNSNDSVASRLFNLAGELDPNALGWFPAGTTGGQPNSDLYYNLVVPMPSVFAGSALPPFWTAFNQTKELATPGLVSNPSARQYLDIAASVNATSALTGDADVVQYLDIAASVNATSALTGDADVVQSSPVTQTLDYSTEAGTDAVLVLVRPDESKVHVGYLTLYQYTMGTPGSLSTATYDAQTYDSSFWAIPGGILFGDSGNKLFIGGSSNSGMTMLDLPAPFDMTVDASTQTSSFGSVTSAGDLGGIVGFGFNSAGTVMVGIGGGNARLFAVGLNTAWTPGDGFTTISDYDARTDVGFIDVAGGCLSSDGTVFYAVTDTFGDYFIHKYTLNTAYDTSSVTYQGQTDVTSLGTGISGVAISGDDATLYVLFGGSQTVVSVAAP